METIPKHLRELTKNLSMESIDKQQVFRKAEEKLKKALRELDNE